MLNFFEDNFLAQKNSAKRIEMNMINFIDVLLFLVIFYMLTTNWVIYQGIFLNLNEQKSSIESSISSAGNIDITIDSADKILINDHALSHDSLKNFLVQQKNKINSARITTGKDAPIQALINILEILNSFQIKITAIRDK